MSILSPPCWYTNDHQWHGKSMCPECGARLRCLCGRFVREDNLEAHMDACPTMVRLAALDATGAS